MLAVQTSNKSFQRQFEFSSACQPGAMDAVASTVNIAPPDALEAHQDIAADLRPDFFQVTGKLCHGAGLQAANWTEWPLILRPRLCRDKLRMMSGFDYSVREPF
jgi:hypothetical protein